MKKQYLSRDFQSILKNIFLSFYTYINVFITFSIFYKWKEPYFQIEKLL